MSAMFASLGVANYRRWFLGGLTSNVGTWMSRTAASWLVLVELTGGDMAALGLLTGVMFLPSLLLSTWAGSLADRFPKRRILLATQLVLMVDTALLGTLVVTGTIRLWHVFAILLVDGIAGSIDTPARQAFVSEVVPEELLPNAISLNSMSFNAARLLGPGLAGVLIALWGTGPVFLLNTATFVALWVALLTLDTAHLHPAPRAGGRRGGVREGLRYVAGRTDLKLLLLVGAVMGNFGFNFAITNPVMTYNAFGRGAAEFGILGSLMGVGALTASLVSAARNRPRLRHVVGSLAGFALFSLFAAWAPTFEAFAVLQVPIGFFAITTMVTANTLIQVTLAPGVRGRVMSLWVLGVMGGTPLVGPAVGWVGTTFGPRWTVMVGVVGVGAMAVGALLYILRSQQLRLRLAWEDRRPRWVLLGVSEDVDGR